MTIQESNREDKLWIEDVGVLLRHPDEFFPAQGMTKERNTNALVRLSLYTGVAISFLRRNVMAMVVGVALALIMTFVFARRERDALKTTHIQLCRKPSLKNPYMNKPIVSDSVDTQLQPCRDDQSFELADKYASMYTTRDVEDVLSAPFENRQFLTLSDGGTGPDFSALGEQLAKGSRIR